MEHRIESSRPRVKIITEDQEEKDENPPISGACEYTGTEYCCSKHCNPPLPTWFCDFDYDDADAGEGDEGDHEEGDEDEDEEPVPTCDACQLTGTRFYPRLGLYGDCLECDFVD
jgi:hypothetical protein